MPTEPLSDQCRVLEILLNLLFQRSGRLGVLAITFTLASTDLKRLDGPRVVALP